jgi:hypothetical protein
MKANQKIYLKNKFNKIKKLKNILNKLNKPRLRIDSEKIKRISHNTPIIIGGCARSGTTLLLEILGNHPNIFSIPIETHVFCPTGYSENPNTNIPFNINKLNKIITKYPTNYFCKRWCEKTPKNIIFLKQILKHFNKKVKIINIIRDGRDVVLSIHPNSPLIYWVDPKRWVEDNYEGLKFKKDPNVLTIKYEDLILDYNKTIKQICNFINENPKPLLDLNIKLKKDSIGKWKKIEYNRRINELLNYPQAKALLNQLEYIS